MFSLVAPPALAGTYLAVLLVYIMLSIGNYMIYGIFFMNPTFPTVGDLGTAYFDPDPISFNNIGTPPSASDQTQARTGRIGIVFLCIAASSLVITTKMLYPKPESKKELDIARTREELANKPEIWAPVEWKKMNFMFVACVMVIGNIMMQYFSFWGDFGTYIWFNTIVLMVVGIYTEGAIGYQVQEELTAAPLSASNALFQGVITYGSPNFLAFLLGNYVGVGIMMVERVYLDSIMDITYEAMESGLDYCFAWIIKRVPKYLTQSQTMKVKKLGADPKKRELDDAEADEDEGDSVEPIVAMYAGVSIDTMVSFYFPFMIYLWIVYRSQLVAPSMYNIRQSDMLIYFFFQLSLIPFGPFFDIFVHSCNELFYGWKIYEYLVYSRYRFLQRETRWKGMENTLDECIEEELRTMDHMCFSSQYYFLICMGCNGILFGAFGVQIMGFANYNMFADYALIFVILYMVIIHYIMEYVCIALALRLGLWKIKHENTDWHIQVTAEDELDIPDWEDVKGASHEAYLMNQRITSETFRFKFLSYNRSWIIQQLPQLLTPRTLRRSRPYLINQLARI